MSTASYGMSNSCEGNFAPCTLAILTLKVPVVEGVRLVDTASSASAVMAMGSTEYSE